MISIRVFTVDDAGRAKTTSQWRRSHWLVLSLATAVCSTLAKETGIATFALCLLMDVDVFRLLQQLYRFFLPFTELYFFLLDPECTADTSVTKDILVLAVQCVQCVSGFYGNALRDELTYDIDIMVIFSLQAFP